MLKHPMVTLKNGLRVAVLQRPQTNAAALSLAIECGSRHDPWQQWGISHFLEHMVFRGTALYPSNKTLAQIFEQSGGMLQASTWRDHTSFSCHLDPQYLPNVLKALASMMMSPQFFDIAIERNLVEEELRAELDEHHQDEDLGNLSRKLIWGNRSTLGRRIVGSIESLKKIDKLALRAHHARYYVASNSVLSVAGPLCPQKVFEDVVQAFEHWPKGCPAKDRKAASWKAKGLLTVKQDKASQVALLLTFGSLPERHPLFAASEILSCILDDGMASLLPSALCGSHGLAYELHSGLDCYQDTGLYDIEITLEPQRLFKAVEVLFQVLKNCLHRKITAQELQQAKQRALYRLSFSLDSPLEVVELLSERLLFHKNFSYAQEVQHLESITLKDVHQCAEIIFGSGKIHATLVGPVSDGMQNELAKQIQHFQSLKNREMRFLKAS